MPWHHWSTESHGADVLKRWQKSMFRYVHPAVCLLMSFSHLDPVSGSRHCFSSLSHSAPRGLLLAMRVSGGAHSTCSPGHSLQYVQTVCVGVCPLWLHVSCSAAWSAVVSCVVFDLIFMTCSTRFFWALNCFYFCPFFLFSKPARIQGLCPWLPLPSACRTWTCASSKLRCYSR